MLSRTPQSSPARPLRSARPAGPRVEPACVASGARRRAVRDGDRQTDTAHLLHSLLERDPDVRAAFDGGPAQVLRLRGYLAQRSIGYGLRWRSAAEGSGAPFRPRTGAVAPLSPAAASAVEGAADRARTRGADRASGLDLLAALAADPECRAAEVLRRAGIAPERLAARLECGIAGPGGG
ncbi:peptidase [Streptomyces sp. F63]|uniref:Clp protease N-terminal domain-containing protein n=1 Tax=Streptomyces sp. F63 TaxID=2824887 RepID=UPI001B35D7D3|nr:Clp protease N-terminal domain-containing protein [Streptomyces sp. F63]MBQ0987957.1 peptidase [Streptomyces sp. F63]